MKKPEYPYALEVDGLTVHYGTSPVLWDLHLKIPGGQIVGIMGPNGAGKSTFIKAVLGLLEGTTGTVHLLNHRLKAIRQKVAYVPQQEVFDWEFPMTVYDLVKMGCFPRLGLWKSLRKEDKNTIDNALSLLGLIPLAHRQIGQLSGGQRQRAFLARSIAQKADLYFLDEPFEAVDHVSEEIIVTALRSMSQQGKTIFIVHHDFVSAGKYFDWVILLNTRLVSFGPFHKVFTLDNIRNTYGKTLVLVEDVLKISSEYATGRKTHDPTPV